LQPSNRSADNLFSTLWLELQDRTSIAAIVNSARAAQPIQVTVDTIICQETTPAAALALIFPERIHSLVNIQSTPDIAVAEISNLANEAFSLALSRTDFDGVYHALATIPTTDSRWQRFERWVAGATPHIVPVFLNHSDFIDIGAALAKFGEVEVSRITARRPSDQSSLNRGWKARVGLARPSHLEAISAARHEGASVRTVTLSVPGRLSVHLRRRAGATYYGGEYELFEGVILTRLAAAASRRLKLTSNRQREVAAASPAPLVIDLGREMLETASDTAQLVEDLQNSRDLAVAVLHRNPYLHVIVTDFTDGSNFDVFVTRADQVEIHPGFRSSSICLTRLTQVISECLEADQIREKQPQPRARLEDLVAG
jgi:hypothetical protein